MAVELMGAKEIGQRLGLSRQRVQQLTARKDWPTPVVVLAMGKIWDRGDVEAWVALYRPDP